MRARTRERAEERQTYEKVLKVPKNAGVPQCMHQDSHE